MSLEIASFQRDVVCPVLPMTAPPTSASQFFLFCVCLSALPLRQAWKKTMRTFLPQMGVHTILTLSNYKWVRKDFATFSCLLCHLDLIYTCFFPSKRRIDKVSTAGAASASSMFFSSGPSPEGMEDLLRRLLLLHPSIFCFFSEI